MDKKELKQYIYHYYDGVIDILNQKKVNPYLTDLIVAHTVNRKILWLYKDEDFYSSSKRLIDYYTEVIELKKHFQIIEVPFCVNLNKKSVLSLFPGRLPIDVTTETKSTFNKKDKLPQDYCLIGIRAFYEDLSKFDKHTTVELLESMIKHPSYITDPFNIKDRAGELFVVSHKGLLSKEPEEDYPLRANWDTLSLVKDACCYAENLKPYLMGGKLKEKDLYYYLSQKTMDHFSPVLIKELSEQIYFDTCKGKYKGLK